MNIKVFTFWVDQGLYAVDALQVLCIQQDCNSLKPVPMPSLGLKGMATYNGIPAPVFDFAERMGIKASSQKKQQMIQGLKQLEQQLDSWFNMIEQNIQLHQAVDLNIPSHWLAPESWLSSVGLRDTSLQELIRRLAEPYKKVQLLSVQLKPLLAVGDYGQAKNLVVQYRYVLEQLKVLFSQSCHHISDSIRPVILYITQDGKTPKLGLILEDIHDVLEYSESLLYPIAKTALAELEEDAHLEQIRPVLKAFIRDKNQPCLLIEPSQILLHSPHHAV